MTLRFASLSLFVLLCAVSVCGAPVCAQISLADRLEDLRRETAVLVALATHAEMSAYDVTVEAADGVVVLSGLVPTLGARDRVVSYVASLPDVRIVRSTLRLEGQPSEPLEDPVVLRQGEGTEVAQEQREELDAPDQEPAEAGPRYYTVRRGDTLYGIARRHETTISAISRLNNLRSTTLRVGQRLRVK